MKLRKRTVVEVEFWIRPRASDMDEREPCNPRSCKWMVGGARSAIRELGGQVTKFWVDGGHIRFSFNGYRWQADTPKDIKADLIALDTWDRLPPKEKAATPPPEYMKPVKVIARQLSKIVKTTPEKLRLMKDRRAARLERGEKDRQYSKKTLNHRVAGFA